LIHKEKQMPSNSKLLLTTSLLVSMGFGSATALAQTAGTPATGQAPAGRLAAPPAAVLSPEQIQTQKLIADAQRQAQDAVKKAAAEAAERERLKRESLVRPAATPEQRAALRAAQAEERKKDTIEATPRVQAALVKEAQVRDALVKSTVAAQELQNRAVAAQQNAVKLKSDADALSKPNPALGANFTPQNVTPVFQGLDNLTKGLAAIKTAADLPPPKMASLNQELARLMDYMGKVDVALDGVKLAGVETPANKEAMTLYMRMPEFAKPLQAEMARVEKLVPQAKPMFDKFRQ
jgi:hypothetical protein